MDVEGYYDDYPLPVDALVLSFVEADFLTVAQNHVKNRGGDPTVIHLRDCDSREAASNPGIESATTCSGGTCDIPPRVSATISCGHRRFRNWSVTDETVLKLLERIAAFSDARAARLDEARARVAAREA